MIVLYGDPISTYCAKVRVVLAYKGIDHAYRLPPDGYGSQTYRAIVPMGSIPGLVDGDLVLSESEAIVEYLEERYPAAPMLPANIAQRAYVRSLSRIHDCWVEPQLRAMYPHANPTRRDSAFLTQRAADFQRRLDGFASYANPAPFIAGEQLTLADCAWPTTFLQAELLLAALKLPWRVPSRLQSWRDRLATHAAMRSELDACRAAMMQWLKKVGAIGLEDNPTPRTQHQ